MSFNSLLRQTIDIQNIASSDLHGKKTVGSATTVRARVEKTRKTVLTAERDEQPIHAIAALPPATSINKGAKVTFESDDYRVMEINVFPGRNGMPHHIEIMMQLWEFGA